MKRVYVCGIRGLSRGLTSVGVRGWLERRRSNRAALFLRSLMSIYDFQDMIRLDIPWWTFGAAAEVEAFLKAKGGRARVFEYGPGASTAWLAARAGSVSYVEHDPDFHGALAAEMARLPNVSGQLVEPVAPPAGQAPRCSSQRAGYQGLEFAAYVAAIGDAGGPFDLIIVDGRARPHCLAEAVKHLAKGGMILFDDTQRARYGGALAAAGLPVERYRGLRPALPYVTETSLLRGAA
ncbi:MAG: class I SAM-dependent methyltransferase [Actinomycetota bacterium]